MKLLKFNSSLQGLLTTIALTSFCGFITADASWGYSLNLLPTIPKEVPAKEGDTLLFEVELEFEGGDYQTVTGVTYSISFDNQELSVLGSTAGNLQVTRTVNINNSQVFDDLPLKFRVKTPLKDGKPDVFFRYSLLYYGNRFSESHKDGADVIPVPEPFTILGSGIMLGFGAFLKYKQNNQNS